MSAIKTMTRPPRRCGFDSMLSINIATGEEHSRPSLGNNVALDSSEMDDDIVLK